MKQAKRDIVERLRDADISGHGSYSALVREAADEIELLRSAGWDRVQRLVAALRLEEELAVQAMLTGKLRWRGGALEQEWAFQTYENGNKTAQHEEWHPVPTVDPDEGLG